VSGKSSGTVDQYELNFIPYKMYPLPTREKAQAYLPLAYEHEFVKGRWIPKNAPHSYCEARILYVEVEVK
jgi:hypothetical protein